MNRYLKECSRINVAKKSYQGKIKPMERYLFSIMQVYEAGVCVFMCVYIISYLTWFVKRSLKVGNNNIMDKARLMGINEKTKGISKDRKWRGRLLISWYLGYFLFHLKRKKKITENVRHPELQRTLRYKGLGNATK